MGEKKLNKYGMEPLKPINYFVYGLGNFGSQLSWTMVSTYLSLFYTDVFGLGTGAVALLMLIAKIWDGVNDPMMGTIMERTHTRFGRFRPYIFVGAFFLVVFTILTFTVPGFGSVGKLVWAYVTYIGLGMSYTMTNVPYLALPVVMTKDPKEINRLNAAQMMGMTIGQIVLNLTVLKLVLLIGHGDQAAGYKGTATILALIALPIFISVAVLSKERIHAEKKYQGSIGEGLKNVFTNKNLMMAILYSFFNMFGMMGRISVCVYFYLYVVQNMQFVTIFMMMQMLVGTFVMPLAAKLCDKYGKKKVAIASMVIQGGALIILFFGPVQSVAFNFIMLVAYGFGYIGGPCGSGMMADAIDDYDLKKGVRNDGMAYSFSGTATKIATAIANALFLVIMGAYGYKGGVKMTPHIQMGINVASNLIPGIIFFVGIIPILIYDLDRPGYMEDVRMKLVARNKAREAEASAEEKAE
jgi:GPH family glycoside/pentoside/hexuronide:cation symporter